MFKIVQTVEEDEVTLCVVPENWEKNGVLFWPPGKKGISLRKDANSMPNCQTWSKQNCVVKKHSIKTFNEANKIEHHLSQFVDTEDEESYNLAREPPAQQRVTDFNYLIDKQPAVVEIQTNNNVSNTNLPPNKEVFYCTEPATATNNNIINKSSATLSMPLEYNITTTYGDGSTHLVQKTCTNDNIIIAMDEEQATFPSNFDILQEQQQFRTDISSLHVKFDKLLDVLIKKSSTTPNNDPQNSDDLLDKSIEKMLPLSSEQNIHELEAKLQEKEFEAAFVKYMSKIGGTAGNKNASKISYMVMDRVFERALLIQCSWTGSTKKKDVKKISFLRFTRVIDAIFKIINLADSRYTVKDNDDFLRRILKNSVSRNNQVKAAHQRKAAPNPQDTTDIDKTNDTFLEAMVSNSDNLDDIESND